MDAVPGIVAGQGQGWLSLRRLLRGCRTLNLGRCLRYDWSAGVKLSGLASYVLSGSCCHQERLEGGGAHQRL